MIIWFEKFLSRYTKKYYNVCNVCRCDYFIFFKPCFILWIKKKTKVYLLCMCILITTISCPSSSFYCLINNRHHSTIKSNWWCCYCSCCWWWWWWFNTSWYEQTILFDLKYILSSFCPYIKLGFIVIRIYTISSKSSVDRL